MGKLWTGSVARGPERAGDSQILAFPDKKPEEAKLLTLGVNDTRDVGPQFSLVKNDDTTFLARLGGGYSKDYPGLSDGKGITEMLLGCQLEQQLSRHNKVFGGLEYAGDPADFGHHRVRATAAWEVLLDSENNLSLRTSVLEASNSAPNAEQAKSLKYAVDLVWKF